MKRKNLIMVVGGVMVLVLAIISFYYWHRNAFYVITEDACINGTIYRASPQVAGKLVEINIQEGDVVQAGDIVARLEDTTLPLNANPDLAVIRAPIRGVVIKKLANTGEVAAPGQSVAMIVDPASLYVKANIEETKVSRVRPGQKVDITVDSLPGKEFTGHVVSIQKATLSTFSLLPQSNSNGNFTKVVQRVEVKIAFDNHQGDNFLFGTNAVVRIHVR